MYATRPNRTVLSNGTNLGELIALGADAWVFNNMELTQADFAMICKVLPLVKITSLLLGNNHITDLSPLADALHYNITVKRVALYSNKITHFPSTLVDALGYSKTLMKLDLDDNDIDIGNLACLETDNMLTICANMASGIEKNGLNDRWERAEQPVFIT